MHLFLSKWNQQSAGLDRYFIYICTLKKQEGGYAQHNALKISFFFNFESYFILSSNECSGLLGHFIKNKDLISEECICILLRNVNCENRKRNFVLHIFVCKLMNKCNFDLFEIILKLAISAAFRKKKIFLSKSLTNIFVYFKSKK